MRFQVIKKNRLHIDAKVNFKIINYPYLLNSTKST